MADRARRLGATGRSASAALVLATWLGATVAHGTTATPTASPTPAPPTTPATPSPTLTCYPDPEVDLSFAFVVDPPAPQVGDEVSVTVSVHKVAGGLAGLPTYSFWDYAGVLELLEPVTQPPGPYVGGELRARMRAIQEGTADLRVFVSFETTVCPMGPYYYDGEEGSFSFEVSARCIGDCNGNRTVEVAELVEGVHMALGTRPVTACPRFEARFDHVVTVDELVSGVENSLNGCDP